MTVLVSGVWVLIPQLRLSKKLRRVRDDLNSQLESLGYTYDKKLKDWVKRS